jgi:hypothetical protein
MGSRQDMNLIAKFRTKKSIRGIGPVAGSTDGLLRWVGTPGKKAKQRASAGKKLSESTLTHC